MPRSIELIRDLLFLAILAASAATDLRQRRILNALTYPAILVGLLLHLVEGSDAFLSSALGAATAAVVMWPLCRVGGMGLGDLKLLAAVGALEGFAVGTAALIDSTFAGGLIALAVTAYRGTLVATMLRALSVPLRLARSVRTRRRFRPADPSDTIPYGVAIAVGAAAAWWFRWPWG